MIAVEGTGASFFYTTGGTLQADAPSYVERRADTDLVTALRAGEFCYVLDTRQVGKSSLMLRAAARLREEGVRVVVLDLTEIGQNLTVEQWYYGLLRRLGEQIGMEEPLVEFWREHREIGPLNRWMAALDEVVLRGIDPESSSGPLVIFVDEIDAVGNLPFSTDEFFAGVRECYNRRAKQPEFARLTFCLLGVTTPADLILDARTTPFNVGRRIELNDFTEDEALPLARGLSANGGDGAALLRRVLHWTNGHPYLTQRLCRAVAERPEVTGAAGVDRVCEDLFLSRKAQDTEDNLVFVRRQMLSTQADLAGVLDLFGRVRSRPGRVMHDETSPLVSAMLLSGAVRATDGFLRIRNRIYHRVFDRAWITRNMPDAELRRARAAYRKGLLRAAAIACAGLAVVGTLAFSSYRLSQARQRALDEKQAALERARLSESKATREAREKAGALVAAQRERDRARKSAAAEIAARRQAQIAAEHERAQRLVAQSATLRARERALRASRYRYNSDMSLALREYEGGNLKRAWELVQAHRRGLDPVDFRGFEWRYLWRLCNPPSVTLTGPPGEVSSVAFSPDGRRLATVCIGWDWRSSDSRPSAAKIWDAATGRELLTLNGPGGAVTSVAFSPDGKRLVTGSADNTAKLWDAATGRLLLTLKGHSGRVRSVAFSPDGRRVMTAGYDKTAKTWDVATGKEQMSLDHGDLVVSAVFSPDGTRAVTAGGPGAPGAKLWDLSSGQVIRSFELRSRKLIYSAAFSPDGKRLAICGDEMPEVWDLEGHSDTLILGGHASRVTSVAFSPDGKQLATCSLDLTARLWDAHTGNELARFGCPDQVYCVTFSPDGKLLAAASGDGTAELWNARKAQSLLTHDVGSGSANLAFSSDGKRVATAGDNPRIWDVETLRELAAFRDAGHAVRVALSGDGRRLASLASDNAIRIWDTRTGRELRQLKASPSQSTAKPLALAADGKRVAAASSLTAATVWNTDSGRRLAVLPGHDEVVSVALSPDGKRVATGDARGVGRVWDVTSGRKVVSLYGHVGWIYCVAFSPDGKRIATGHNNGLVMVWDAGSGRNLAEFRAHAVVVLSLAFSPDGARIVTGGSDGTLKVWDAETASEVLTLKGLNGTVSGAAFCLDGNRLVAGDWDKTIRVWVAATDAEVAAHERAERRPAPPPKAVPAAKSVGGKR